MRSLCNRQGILFILLLPLLYSCATILNKPVQRISLATSENVKVLSVQKAIATDSSSTTKEYFVPRSNQHLVVTVKVDSSIRKINLKPKKSFAYWFNIVENYGIGMLVDAHSLKRYSYPSSNYFFATASGIKVSRYAPVEKGTINISFSMPIMINGFNIKTSEGMYKSGGVYGAKLSADYFYKPNNYLSITAGAATDIFGEYFLRDSGHAEHGYAFFASSTNHKLVGSFDIGYGLHVSQLKWRKEFGDTTKSPIVVKNMGIGPAISTSLRLGKYSWLGVFYQPLLFDTKSMSFTNYQHYMSLDLLFRLPLHTPRKYN